ncbi:PREDICTED: uncharacterized protein LOC104595929 isoform X2 [Nelumbo nucifera]|uniref:Uncharacterized protein LOC104595929 isoform X2 n=1 Tax=Nelumbo nucifera TaxID=4432 RepID=A0A1U7ZSY8_NELNU|nr:PREDICTED: uncharacterized protein LOC104595929 isoform X2 [Nelumbo nucifera]
MSIGSCNKFVSFSLALSLPTFVKQLATSKITFCYSYNINRKYLTTTRCFNYPHLETLNSRQKEQICIYVDALLQWNQRMNLTAVKETSEVMERHVEDSLAIIPPIQNYYLSNCSSSCDNISLVDVGSGPGLPGLIIAIACPGQSVGQNLDFREMYDVAVARAVAEMRILAEYCLPLVRVGGLFVAAKGHEPQDEIRKAEKAIHLMGASILQLFSVESHSPHGQRTAIVCLKDRPTPRKYPRDPGTPTKLPL